MNSTSRRKFLKKTSLAGLSLSFFDFNRITPQGYFKPQTRDFAESKFRADWLQHSVLGGPSFDSFERLPGNPIFRGEAPLEWPVNGFFFIDPVSGDFFVYVGAYAKGYLNAPSRCIGLRSSDKGKTWKNLGTLIGPDSNLFDKGGHTPDVSVVYEKGSGKGKSGRYHMIYDWGEPDFNKEGGIAYAWADKPEGPWTRAKTPVTRNTELPLIENRYRRTYAATLIRREKDWMITGMMDDAPHSWTLFVMTAPNPEGPYSERKLVRNVRDNYFLPPLMEFFPSFVHDGYLYAPATSVALNRDYVVMFRAPLEKATETSAWEIYQNGSNWHSESVESEFDGLWGQTFSGQIEKNTLWAMFPSRDEQNRGTINIAKRTWDKPFREKGVVLNAHAGPSLSLLRAAYGEFEIKGRVTVNGTAQLVWDYEGILGPDKATSDATLGTGVHRSYASLQFSANEWKIISYDNKGQQTTEAKGDFVTDEERVFTLRRNDVGNMRLMIDDQIVWRGTLYAKDGKVIPSQIGWYLEPRTRLEIAQLAITGEESPAHFFFDATDALLGAGENASNWKSHTEGFKSTKGFSTTRKDLKAKWNVHGKRFTLWFPKGPEFGSVEVFINGESKGRVNLNASKLIPSKPLWKSDTFPDGDYAVTLSYFRGPMAVDCLEVEQ